MRIVQRYSNIGFTLIEIMVAVAIFALISAITFPSLIQFLDIRERVIKKNESIANMQKTFLFFSRDVNFAVNRLGKDEFGEPADASLIVGDDSLIEMTSVYQDFNLDGKGVPRKVKWLYEDKQIIRVQYPVMDPDGDTRVYKQRLLDDVEDVEIQVYSIEDGRDSQSKRWSEEDRLPHMIQLKIQMNDGGEYERVFTMLGGSAKKALDGSEVRPITN